MHPCVCVFASLCLLCESVPVCLPLPLPGLRSSKCNANLITAFSSRFFLCHRSVLFFLLQSVSLVHHFFFLPRVDFAHACCRLLVIFYQGVCGHVAFLLPLFVFFSIVCLGVGSFVPGVLLVLVSLCVACVVVAFSPLVPHCPPHSPCALFFLCVCVRASSSSVILFSFILLV